MGLRDCPPTKETKGEQFVRICRTFNFVGNGTKCAKERTLRDTMIQAILAAKRFIYIEDQYLVNPTAAVCLMKALPNIQHLTILIPHGDISDLPWVWSKRREFINVLMAGEKAKEKVRIFYRFNRSGKKFGEHSYIHAKTWVFDDELAIIGSANCNVRGWESDSEVMAAICDKPHSVKNMSFAQKLRARLWAEHLGVPMLNVADGFTSADLWIKLPSTASVMRYNPLEGRDNPWEKKNQVLDWGGKVDPFPQLKACGDGTRIAH